MDTYNNQYETAEKSIGMIRYACYGFLLTLGLIGILNLINTIMNRVYVRRRGVRDYIYPLIPTVILILTVLAVQMIVMYLVNRSFKKQRLIDRIRFA
ncbi:hypothetical protein AALA78_09025 [Lachnospiraceae bacterium 42-17]